MATMLLVDPQAAVHAELKVIFEDAGHCLVLAATLAEARDLCLRTVYDLVVVDEDQAGPADERRAPRDLLRFFKEHVPRLVMLTEGSAPPPDTVRYVEGDVRYIAKEGAPGRLISLIEQMDETRERVDDHPNTLEYQIYGKSPSLLQAFEHLWRYARSSASVLLTGGTGTGKELFAKALHKMSPRCDGPFITIDCASLPETLVESLLFGYNRGAFTGANSSREGLIKLADGGTLFLDEVGELSLDIQRKFLRVLQERRFRSVGGGRETVSDFRVVAATNRDLPQMVADGLFREDLCFRLKILQIELPPLAERGGDIVIIAQKLLDRCCDRENLAHKGISSDLQALLMGYSWPGNIRELVNVMESLFAMAWDKPLLRTEDLPRALYSQMLGLSFSGTEDRRGNPEFAACRRQWERRNGSTEEVPAAIQGALPVRDRRQGGGQALFSAQEKESQPLEGSCPVLSAAHAPGNGSINCFKEERRRILEEFERDYLTQLYARYSGKIADACETSRLSRPRLYELYRKYGILQVREQVPDDC